MARIVPAVFAAGLAAGVSFAAPQVSKSSAIPERREFPVNDKLNPCDNFYDYACSKVVEGFQLRPDRSRHTFAFDDSNERLLEKKKSFLKDISLEATKGAALSPRSQALANVYLACMDPKAGAEDERRDVKETLAKVKGLADRQAFASFLAEERSHARPSFFSVGNMADLDHPELYNFYFDVELMSLPERSYYENKALLADYRKVLTTFFQTLGEKKAKEKADQVIAFESEYAKVYPRPEDWRKIMVERRPISREELLKTYPNFKMEALLAKVPSDTVIRHLAPEAYAYAQKQLETRDLEALKATYLFHALAGELDDGYPAFFKQYRDFQVKHLGASKQRPVREERCTKLVMGTFPKEVDAELLPKIFPDFPDQKFVDLAEHVRASILAGIESNQWLSAEGKAGAKQKMKSARLQLVKPRNDAEWYFNPEVSYSPKEPLANIEKLQDKLQERMFDELKKPRDTNVWQMGPLTVNAYYSPEDNKFVMPVGILQYPFYDPSLPLEVNLGSVGAVIGHELGHGIDDQGAMFDADGRLKQWMSDADIQSFQSRGAKFVEQFNKIGHNGSLTLGENIGDLTGVTFAYRAAFPEGKGSEEQKRNFFLQYARVWCGVTLPKMQEMQLKTDPHSLGWARVNQQMKNQPDFAKAFQCKSSDPMVLPEAEIVKIW